MPEEKIVYIDEKRTEYPYGGCWSLGCFTFDELPSIDFLKSEIVRQFKPKEGIKEKSWKR